MKHFLLLFVVASFVLTSCENYGEKVEINDKSEVYYKGDGVTEADAKKLGDFLLQKGYFNTTDDRTVQLLKTGDAYEVRFVVDESKIKEVGDAEALQGFRVWQYWISENVFGSAKTKVVLADNKLEPLKEVGEFSAQEKEEMKAYEIQMQQGGTDAVDNLSSGTDTTGTGGLNDDQ